MARYNSETMFTDIQDYLRYYRGLNKRTMRDIAALPPEAAGYQPPASLAEKAGDGEKVWSIGEIVGHIAGARLYFARAYRDEGWIFDGPLRPVQSQDEWIQVLEESFEEFTSRLADTPTDWLQRRIELIDTEGTVSGWRILMMCIEHEVHHRSQVDTYAGLNGWDPPQIYGRSAEQVGLERERQQEKHSAPPA
jgi:uncharacterized damage-inducible protein DinB